MPIDKDGNEIPQSTHNLVGYRESLQLFYSPNHELSKSITIKDEGLKVVKTVTHYYYDAFGRRIGKSSSTQKSSKLNQRGELVRFPSNLSSLNTTDRPQRKNTLMLWDGNRQIQEITDDFTFTTVYEQNSFVPVARIVERQPHLLEQAKRDEQTEWAKYENMQLTKRSKANIHHKIHTGLRIYHYHTDHLGTPQELTNDRGEVVWLNYQMAWGGSFSQLNNVHNLDGLDISSDELQPFRFQGQFFDGETGLHYNRFRYYDSDVGMFIQRDPIELLGGFNVFAYAPNPIHWIDPFGLAIWHDEGVDFKTWFDKASVEDIENNLKDVKSQSGLRYGGGSHEHFPVSIAPKAKELGFSADELEKLTTPTQNITFSGVKDKEGNILPDSGHHQTRAGRYFHIELIKSLKDATSKEEAMSIMKTLHDKHMKVSNPCNKT